MEKFEYKVVPAPKRGKRGKGVRGSEGKFANALETVMNDMGALGWQYLRTDTLPSEERQGLTGRTTVFQNMLVFYRPVDVEFVQPVALITDASDETEEAPQPDAADDAEPQVHDDDANATQTDPAEEAATNSPDEPKDYDGPDLNSALKTRADQVKSREGAASD
ncbi:DUF4177 domain-containing protein [Algirhabdus cladophorae]|uniref:DUF4177 domain-containing protein n=1 Tax=Algirhabdus cladophorae TaxID=3377108 RepID=UPI003B847190